MTFATWTWLAPRDVHFSVPCDEIRDTRETFPNTLQYALRVRRHTRAYTIHKDTCEDSNDEAADNCGDDRFQQSLPPGSMFCLRRHCGWKTKFDAQNMARAVKPTLKENTGGGEASPGRRAPSLPRPLFLVGAPAAFALPVSLFNLASKAAPALPGEHGRMHVRACGMKLCVY